MPLTRVALQDAMASFDRLPSTAGPAQKHAAVALLVVADPDRDDVALVLTRRAAGLRAHGGQWAFPGGRIDPGESVHEAALREVQEEIGVAVDPAGIVGELDDYVTRSGYRMTPVVIWAADGPFHPVADPDEVESVHPIPMAEVDVEPRFLTIPESDRPVVQVPLSAGRVHAPTGAILHQFREVVLHGRPTRVAHLEQPVFAWR